MRIERCIPSADEGSTATEVLRIEERMRRGDGFVVHSRRLPGGPFIESRLSQTENRILMIFVDKVCREVSRGNYRLQLVTTCTRTHSSDFIFSNFQKM
jgi:hypothetical protein